MKWARIENNYVVELTDIDPEGRFTPDLVWGDCSDDVDYGWDAKLVGGAWVFTAPVVIDPDLDETKVSKRTLLREYCSNDISRTSFSSTALGEVHNYDCRLVDQMNLKTRYDVTLHTGGTEPVWASDGTRFEWKEHTSGELILVISDMNEHIKFFQVKLANKLASIDAATTVTQVNSISW